MIKKKILLDNFKTLIYALFLAIIIRSLIIQPFYIPSSSMELNLLVGDRLFVTKYSYGYSKHSFPFSPPFFKGRIFKKDPKRGDIIVFKTPSDNRTDYIKRLIGLPGDIIQFIDGNLYINNNQIFKSIINNNENLYCGNQVINVSTFEEKLPNNKSYIVSYRNDVSFQNSDKFIVPENHYFFLGDNRDCSKDSRFLSEVGYVHNDNLVGKAQILFFSSDRSVGSIFQIWNWPSIIRYDRFFKKLN
mgnify:CR=1 FL=1|tara:strand:- start:5877 stop:6611 length:735 start_codon:yes stop_codon:yes gene_type:complete